MLAAYEQESAGRNGERDMLRVSAHGADLSHETARHSTGLPAGQGPGPTTGYRPCAPVGRIQLRRSEREPALSRGDRTAQASPTE